MNNKIFRILCSIFLLILTFCIFIYRIVFFFILFFTSHQQTFSYLYSVSIATLAGEGISDNRNLKKRKFEDTPPIKISVNNITKFYLSSYLQGCGKTFGSLSLLKQHKSSHVPMKKVNKQCLLDTPPHSKSQ